MGVGNKQRRKREAHRERRKAKTIASLQLQDLTASHWIGICACIIRSRESFFEKADQCRAKKEWRQALTYEDKGVKINDILLAINHPAAILPKEDMEWLDQVEQFNSILEISTG